MRSKANWSSSSSACSPLAASHNFEAAIGQTFGGRAAQVRLVVHEQQVGSRVGHERQHFDTCVDERRQAGFQTLRSAALTTQPNESPPTTDTHS